MNKKEFLNILRQYLEGEVDNSILEQSVSFYNEYISSQLNKTEEEVINEIGDPRLIAKTIIDTENTAHGDAGNYNSYDNRGYDYTGDNDNRSSSNNNKVYHIKWYHMVLIAIILVFLFAFIIRIGWMLIRLFFVFFLPIIFIALLWAMFRKR
ncbi:MAG: DUF1700 domain-containing protein [Clostridiales bacterium]|jgi:uncharacterized membrane protein|nr:DUF1700 domain-containing protein [Clostridiales bacterium]